MELNMELNRFIFNFEMWGDNLYGVAACLRADRYLITPVCQFKAPTQQLEKQELFIWKFPWAQVKSFLIYVGQ